MENFQSLVSTFDDFLVFANDEESNQIHLKRRFRELISNMNKTIDKIESDISVWKETLGISEYDMSEIVYIKSSNEYKFTPTIPINANGLSVDFEVNVIISPIKTVVFEVATNLFDDAELLISIHKDTGALLGQDKVKVINGCFRTSEFSNKGIGYESGLYTVEIMLPVASVQPKCFVVKAGIEYENLIGDYVDRDSISPTVKYTKEFHIK